MFTYDLQNVSATFDNRTLLTVCGSISFWLGSPAKIKLIIAEFCFAPGAFYLAKSLTMKHRLFFELAMVPAVLLT